jgi:hypothetical protein
VSFLAGAKAPERFRLTIENSPSDPDPLDLSTVISVTMTATCQDLINSVWPVSVVAQSSNALTIEHVFDSYGAEIERTGIYRLNLELTVPTGVRRAGPTTLRVY